MLLGIEWDITKHQQTRIEHLIVYPYLEDGHQSILTGALFFQWPLSLDNVLPPRRGMDDHQALITCNFTMAHITLIHVVG